MLSKRVLAQSFYESICPRCGYRTKFAACQLVQREYRNNCNLKKDYDVISYDIKCQLCLNKFRPNRHRTANFFENPMKAQTFTPVQQSYICGMKSFHGILPKCVGGIRLSQELMQLKYKPEFDNVSVFLSDEIAAEDSRVHVFITGHNLNQGLLQCQLGLECVDEIPLNDALSMHFEHQKHMVGDVSHVTRR